MLGYDMAWATFAVVEAGFRRHVMNMFLLLKGVEHEPFLAVEKHYVLAHVVCNLFQVMYLQVGGHQILQTI